MPGPQVAERYDYVDEHGKLLYRVERLAPKGFRCCKPDGHGWAYRLGDTRRVLYRLPAVLDAVARGELICVVEGEKDVHTLDKHGKLATTNAGGAGNWDRSFSECLRGAKVAVIADDDEPGHAHAWLVARSLDRVAAKVKVLVPTKGKDVTEHLANGGKLGELRELDPPTNGNGNGNGRVREIVVMTTREICALPDPDTSGYLLGPLVNRGHRLMLAARTGHGKTSWLLAVIDAIVNGKEFLDWEGMGGCKALVLDVEQGIGTIKRRVREAGLAECDDVHYAIAPDGLALDSDPEAVKQVEELLLRYRPQVVLADPFYKLHRGDPNDMRAAVDLMRRFDDWRSRMDFALLLPMHIRKAPPAGRAMTMDDIFGSSSYEWGAELVLGLERRNNGYSHLYWWKDREGELELVDARWGLCFERGKGFWRDPRDLDDSPVRDRVRDALEVTPGMTIDELRDETGAKQTAIRHALDALGALHTGERAVKNRHWQLPDSLFRYRDGAFQAAA